MQSHFRKAALGSIFILSLTGLLACSENATAPAINASEPEAHVEQEARLQAAMPPDQMGDLTPVPMTKVNVADNAVLLNIIYILVDDMGYGDVSYNGSQISTPNLDQMGKDGVTLDRFYAFPICSPTRTALMTGRSALDYGVTGPLGDDYVAAPKQAFLPQYFKSAGYETWMVGKWHLGLRETGAFPISRGFDYHYGFLGGFIDFYTHIYRDDRDWQRNGKTIREEGHATDLLTEDAIELIEAHDGEKPFFLYLSYNARIHRYINREGATSAYDDVEDEGVRVYSQMVDHLDNSVGKVREAIAAKGIENNTLVVFTSDNGAARDAGSSGGLRGRKGSIHDGGMRVPGLAVWPDVLPEGVKSDYPVFVQNWAPTLLEAAGIKAADDAFTGTSAWPGLTGNTDSNLPGTTIVGSVEGVAVFEWPYKMIRKVERGENPGPEVQELYNLVADPFETNELTDSEPAIVARLAKILDGRTVMPLLNDTGPSPQTLHLNEDGSNNYNVRFKETTPPWAERAKGNTNP